MRSAVSLLFVFSVAANAAQPILLLADDPGSWPNVLGSVGLTLTQATGIPPSQAPARVTDGAVAILEGPSATAEQFGIKPTSKRVPTRSIVDERNPKLPIVWERTLDLPVFELPAGARVFARERWSGAPVVAGFQHGKGAVLWVAATPGAKGYERFPYLLHALSDLGVKAPFQSRSLWAFFDSSYRLRVDVDYFAKRWRKAGIGVLHVAAWHYNEQDPERDAYLKKLIEACHRNAILVYAWVELPHVSERFWEAHPEWREKTALLQDAHLDWRKLMNLNDPDCFAAVSQSVHGLIGRFDWDGVNLAELYFESLEGAANPARFTPMNERVRSEYTQLAGVDPLTFFQESGSKDGLTEFLQYRAALAKKMQEQWIGEIEKARVQRPELDLVLTHVDDRFDTRMRDLIGADAARLLPMLDRHDFTFLIEDPATIWHLGPERYPQIAERYAPLTKRTDKLAIDINIVDRYQDVYPTKQQTGTELFQLVHLAARAFPRVALYFENSILAPDWALLPSSAAVVTRHEQVGGKTVVDSARGVGLSWKGNSLVNGKLWPVTDGERLWLPAGPHAIEAASAAPALRLLDLNGDLKSARALDDGIELAYRSSGRAVAVFDSDLASVEIDGEEASGVNGRVLMLPRGQHLVIVRKSGGSIPQLSTRRSH